MEAEIRDVYNEDTIGRKYRTPIVTKKNNSNKHQVSEPLVTVNVKAPMRKEEFKQLPPSLQAEYIKGLRQNYDATATQIGEMLGYAQGYIHDIIKKLGLCSLFPVGGRKSGEQKRNWEVFVSQLSEPNADEQVETKGRKIYTEPAPFSFPSGFKNKSIENSCVPQSDTTFKQCSFVLTGALDVGDICRKIGTMVPNGTPCEISIRISKNTDKNLYGEAYRKDKRERRDE